MRRLFLRRKKVTLFYIYGGLESICCGEIRTGHASSDSGKSSKFENILGSLTTLKFRVFNGTIFNLPDSRPDISKNRKRGSSSRHATPPGEAATCLVAPTKPPMTCEALEVRFRPVEKALISQGVPGHPST
ncbi:hypothetical protein CEXT_787541 [Caerostris extrusa]|uniref:Uncharacterized protein n=1 Tax=Caerostris extrusa TaxID=172846 RepID=A0AAV4RX01_CAEEX|nr:hypothetical protein CEXT_787541 [Caerostris extrusa]